MRRLCAVLVGAALLASHVQASALHVHHDADHEHPEHHHGPATHEHHARPHHSDEGASRLQACDPATHAASFAFASSGPPGALALTAILNTWPAPGPDVASRGTVTLPETRAHGPPRAGPTSPRAPPSVSPA